MNKIDRNFIKAIPKAELHVHLDGSIRLSTMVDIARKSNIELPSYTVEGLKETVFKPKYRNLDEYLAGFKYTVQILQNEESLERTAYELAEDCANEGIRYLEVRFAPQLHINDHMDFTCVLKAVNRGLETFKKEFNQLPKILNGDEPSFNYGIICCAMRMFNREASRYYQKFREVHPYTRSSRIQGWASEELAIASVDIRDQHGIPIVGIDLAGSEHGNPAEHHRRAYRIAHRNFMNKTVHAGEAYGPESIFQAITDLYADRIGHGFHLYSTDQISTEKIDKEQYVQKLAQYIAERRITLEVCLTSNMQTMPNLQSLEEHALGKFLQHDLSVTIATDNRTVSNTTLTDELILAAETFNITPGKFKDLVIYGFKRSFYPGSYSEKRKYVRQIINYYEKLENDLESNAETMELSQKPS